MSTATESKIVITTLNGGELRLNPEAGDRPFSLFRLSWWRTGGMHAGGMTASAEEMIDLFGAISHLAGIVRRRGLP